MEPLYDYVTILAAALHNEEARTNAALMLRQAFYAHGSHHPRPSDFGVCSLEYLATLADLQTLDRSAESLLVMDTGTLLGTWIAQLIAMQGSRDNYRARFAAEYATEYRGVPGRADLLVDGPLECLSTDREIIEIKTTPSTAAIKAPDAAKPYQCLQAACYALGASADRFTILTFGYNVGKSRDGIPHEKIVTHTYATADFKPLVDAEIDRLLGLAQVERSELDDECARAQYAQESWRCSSCRYAACELNRNPARLAL